MDEADVAEWLSKLRVRCAIVGAIVGLHVREAHVLRQSLIEEGYETALRTGDGDDPIPVSLEIKDRHGNRVDLLIGIRGIDPELLGRTSNVTLAGAVAHQECRLSRLSLHG